LPVHDSYGDHHNAFCAPQEAITNFQKYGSIMRVAPVPPRIGMQRAEAELKQQRVHIEWLSAYLLPSELEVVARASVFAGPFTTDGAVAVGCCAWQPGEQQEQQPWQQQLFDTSVVAYNDDQPRTFAGYERVERVLRGLVLMSVLCEEQAAASGERRFSMHPLIRELGCELRGGRLRGVCGTGVGSVEEMMVWWMLGHVAGPGVRLVLHEPFGSEPNSHVCKEVMAQEAANFSEAARLVDSAGVFGNDAENLGHLRDMLRVGMAMDELGCLQQARQLLSSVVDARTMELGLDHLDTLNAMRSLGFTIRAIGDETGALALQSRVVDGMTRVLGPDHKDTIWNKDMYARMLNITVKRRQVKEKWESIRRLDCLWDRMQLEVYFMIIVFACFWYWGPGALTLLASWSSIFSR
jgi:hypothetical protein